MFFNKSMTLSLRNGLLALALGILILVTVGYGFLAFYLVSQEGWGTQIGPATLVQLILETALAPLGSLFGFLLVRRAFRKSTAPEEFFFALFAASLAGESLLLVQTWLSITGMPSYFTGVLTRTVWAFRFSGLGFLFCASLYAFEFTYRKYGNLVFLSVLAGIFLSGILPLHSSSARNHLLFAVGDAPGLALVTVLVGAVVVLNFFLGGWRPGAPDRARTRAWAALFLLGGWTLAATVAPWGTILAVPGLVMAAWKAEQNPLNG